MLEQLLFAQVSADDRERTLHQLTGVTRMQPMRVVEQHLIFRATPPEGLNQVQVGASQGVMTQELKKTQTMLNGGLYHIQAVRRYEVDSVVNARDQGDSWEQITNLAALENLVPKWSIEFRDIPEAGASQPITSRSVSIISVEDGNVIDFVKAFGYEFTSQYVIEGYKFYEQDVTLFLYRTLAMPPKDANGLRLDATVSRIGESAPLDQSGSSILEASIIVLDGNNHEVRSKATQQLNALKETFGRDIALQPADRLALDTRVNIRGS